MRVINKIGRSSPRSVSAGSWIVQAAGTGGPGNGGPIIGHPDDVRSFDIGILNANGSFTELFTWDTLLQRMTAEWGCYAPVAHDTFGGVAIWLKYPDPQGGGGFLYQRVSDVVPIDQFEDDGAGNLFHLDGIAITPDQIPATPTPWTFIAVSYNRATPMEGNLTSAGVPTSGPQVVLVTLAGVTAPSFLAPGPVTQATWSYAFTGPNLMTIEVQWMPPTTGGPVLGVQVTLQRPGQPDEDLGSIDTPNPGWQYLAATNHPTPAATETWTIRLLAYGQTHLGDPKNEVKVPLAVQPYAPSTQIGAATATVTYYYDDPGNIYYGFSGTVQPPADTQYAYCRIFVEWPGQPAQDKWQNMHDAYPTSNNWREGDGQGWKVSGDTNVKLHFCAVNLADTVNYGSPYTINLTILAAGNSSVGIGRERAALVTNLAANVSYGRNDAGDVTYSFWGTLTPPVGDPRYQGAYLYYLPQGGTLPGSKFAETDATGTTFQSAWFTAPANETGIVYAVSVNANHQANSYQSGTTPQVPVTLRPALGTAGKEYAPVVSGLTGTVNYIRTDTGGYMWTVSGTVSPPADTTAYRGVRLVLRPTSGPDIDIGKIPLGTTTFQSPPQPMPKISTTYSLLALSYDAAGRTNSPVGGVTPVIPVTVNPFPQPIDSTQLDPGTYQGTEFKVSGGIFTFNNVPLNKAGAFNAVDFQIAGGAEFAIKSLSVDKITVGSTLSVGGGANMAGKLAVFDETGLYIGWLGKDSVTGYGGGWFKRLMLGGTAPSSGVKITVASDGSVIIAGAAITNVGTYGTAQFDSNYFRVQAAGDPATGITFAAPQIYFYNSGMSPIGASPAAGINYTGVKFWIAGLVGYGSYGASQMLIADSGGTLRVNISATDANVPQLTIGGTVVITSTRVLQNVTIPSLSLNSLTVSGAISTSSLTASSSVTATSGYYIGANQVIDSARNASFIKLTINGTTAIDTACQFVGLGVNTTGVVRADGGFKCQTYVGQNTAIQVKNSVGTNYTMTFVAGLLVSLTTP